MLIAIAIAEKILQGLYRILGVSEESWIKPENLRFPRTGMIFSVGQKVITICTGRERGKMVLSRKRLSVPTST